MLRREQRLHRAEDFERLRRDGRAFQGRLLLLSCARNELPHNRYGFIVSKRVGKAVVRNRARRLLREAARQLDPAFAPGYDIVLIARPALQEEPLTSVVSAALELAIRAGLVGGPGKLAP